MDETKSKFNEAYFFEQGWNVERYEDDGYEWTEYIWKINKDVSVRFSENEDGGDAIYLLNGWVDYWICDIKTKKELNKKLNLLIKLFDND